jgi:hypothetical protein
MLGRGVSLEIPEWWAELAVPVESEVSRAHH